MPTVDFKQHLLKDLKNIKYAAGYLTAAFEEGEDVFLLALREFRVRRIGVRRSGRISETLRNT